jgi:hypothetical protein
MTEEQPLTKCKLCDYKIELGKMYIQHTIEEHPTDFLFWLIDHPKYDSIYKDSREHFFGK